MLVADVMRRMLAQKFDQKLVAQEAQRWTKSTAFNAALFLAREEVVRRWAAAKSSAAREECWHEYHALEGFPAHLQRLVDDALIESSRKA